MADGYASHKDYIDLIKSDVSARQETVHLALKKAFSTFIEKREVEVILFSNMNPMELAGALVKFPLILKPLLACCNIAGRAIERDLSIKNLNTYSLRLNEDHAKIIAGYIKPFLPPYLEIPTLCRIDGISYIDKEMRKGKGRWEQKILECLNRTKGIVFKKRKFLVGGQEFELDAAYPDRGDIKIGVDIKRIEARRDIHKRCDEIVNKAHKLKSVLPKAKFGAIVYYPFIDEQVNISNRLESENIDGVVFASELDDSVSNAVKMLFSTMKVSFK